MPPSNLLSCCDAIIQGLKEMCDYSLGKSDWVTMTMVTYYFVTMFTIVKDLLIEIIQEIAWRPKSDWTAFSTLCFFSFWLLSSDCYLLSLEKGKTSDPAKTNLCETRFLEVNDLQSEVSPQAFLVKLDLPSQPVHLDQLHVVDLKKANKIRTLKKQTSKYNLPVSCHAARFLRRSSWAALWKPPENVSWS